jgi:hypothetical protein
MSELLSYKCRYAKERGRLPLKKRQSGTNYVENNNGYAEEYCVREVNWQTVDRTPKKMEHLPTGSGIGGQVFDAGLFGAHQL